MPIPTSLTLDLDFTPHLVRMSPGGDEPIMEGPITVEDIIIDAAARIMYERAWSDGTTSRDLQAKVAAQIDATIAAKVTAVVDDFLTTPRQPTDAFGNPKGDPTTLAETITASVQKALNTPVPEKGRSSYDTPQRTVVEWAIDREVKETVAKEVKASVGAEREAIVARVAAGAAQVLTAGLQKALDA